MRIDVSNLKKCFGENTAVNIGEYHIGDGELVGLVGNNGAGKTTLFRLLLDLIKADDGRVTLGFQGEGEGEDTPEMLVDPSKSEDWKNYTGSYIDEGFLIDFLTPEEYFAFIGKVCGISKEEVEERVKTYEPLMAGEILGHKKLIRDLSAGNKQKVGIIAALLNHPQLVILDEPFAMYDEERLESALRFLSGCGRQVILFSCQRRELEMLSKLQTPSRGFRYTSSR